MIIKESARVLILFRLTTDGHKASHSLSATAELPIPVNIKNWTINNSVKFQFFWIKFCMFIVKLFSIISCKVCLNRMRFNNCIMKCVGLQFFLRHTVVCRCKSCCTNLLLLPVCFVSDL